MVAERSIVIVACIFLRSSSFSAYRILEAISSSLGATAGLGPVENTGLGTGFAYLFLAFDLSQVHGFLGSELRAFRTQSGRRLNPDFVLQPLH